MASSHHDRRPIDAMAKRQSGDRRWQLNLREQLPGPPPRPEHVLDLRQPTPRRDERFFEFLIHEQAAEALGQTTALPERRPWWRRVFLNG